MELSYSRLKKAVYLYLALPTVLFLGGWLRPWLGIPAALLVLVGWWFIIRRPEEEEFSEKFHLSRRVLLLLILAVVIWCYLGGQGGLYYQSTDWRYRNAVFRDLITHPWPVRYPGYGRTLVYYIGHWLPPALVGKGILAVSGSEALAWTVGNLALWAWTALGVVLVLLLLLLTVKADSLLRILTALGLLVLFSGMDLAGYLIFRPYLEHQLEWWAGYYQFSSLTTCLFWVFNQTVIPWLATLALLQEKTLRNYAYLGFCVLLCGPMPFVGLVLYMAFFGLAQLAEAFRTRQLPALLKQVFTPQNLIGLLVIFPPVALYLLANSEGSSSGLALIDGSIPATLKVYLPFILLECGIYLLILWRDNRASLTYHATAVILLICPFIRVGSFSDFCMRGSIPALMVLLVLCLRFLFAHSAALFARRWKEALPALVLAACLLIGAATPAVEFARTLHGVLWHKSLLVLCDDIITWDQDFDAPGAQTDGKYYLGNFSCFTPEETLFYQFLAR